MVTGAVGDGQTHPHVLVQPRASGSVFETGRDHVSVSSLRLSFTGLRMARGHFQFAKHEKREEHDDCDGIYWASGDDGIPAVIVQGDLLKVERLRLPGRPCASLGREVEYS